MTPTLILIPGLMCDVRFWQPVISAVGDSRDIHVPKLHDCASLAEMAEAILAEATGPLDVVGHSMGGRVALEIWDQSPERISSLALLDTGVHPVRPNEPERRQALLDLAQAQGMHAVADKWITGMIDTDRADDENLVSAIKSMVTSYSAEQFAGQVQALLSRRDATPVLPRITCPTLIACGSNDAWSPPAQHQEIASQIQGARYAEIDDAGHMVAMERPAETAGLILDWVDSQM